MTAQTRFRVEGMDCAGCAAKIDTAVRRIDGVEDVNVSATAGTMSVRHDDHVDLAAIQKKVASLGYSAAPVTARQQPAGSPKPDNDHAGHDHAGHDHTHEGHDHGHAHDRDQGHDQKHGDGHKHGSTAEAAVSGLHGHDHGPSEGPWWKSAKGRLTIASGAAFIVAWAAGKYFDTFAPGGEEAYAIGGIAVSTWAFTIAMLVGLVPIARRAVMAAVNGMPFTIETLMTIAAVGAVFIGASEEAAAVVFLFLVGEMLEGVAAGRARASIQALTKLVPSTALLEENGGTREVPAEQLAVGAVILVRPGDRISADGEIVEGEGAINEAAVTGESTPVRKGVGDKVFAGTVNGEAALRLRVTAASADNTIARIVRLVEEAQESKAPTERFIDRFSRYYTPGVLVAGALIAVVPPLFFGGAWDAWIYKGLAVLLIGCPCALVISTPAAIAAALSAGARRGLLMKGGAVLEGIGKITAACFDKTGTLTAGKPEVTDVVSFDRGEADVLRLAAALDAGSSHPLALAILAKAEADGVRYPQAVNGRALGGKGVMATVEGEEVFLGSPRAVEERTPFSADQKARIAALNDEGKSVSVLTVGNAVAGAIAMRDEPRPDAKEGLQALAAAGVRTIMLTGDNKRTGEAVGRELGIEARAELLPEDKQSIVGQLQREGLIVAKVGDGINDAPALAAANVGIAMGGGTDVALETADAAVLHGRVKDVARMVNLSRAAMANIRQNITIALGLKAVFLVTTVIGITGLWPAILADTGATVLVTVNAMRLLGWRGNA